MSENLYYRIALTQAGLEKGANFFVIGLPRPDLPPFFDHSERVPQSQGGEARQGYINGSLFWLRLSVSAAGVLRGLIEAAEAGSGLIYLTIPRTDAMHVGVSWIDISCRPTMPVWEPLQGSPWVYENVTLKYNAAVILATPSTVMT